MFGVIIKAGGRKFLFSAALAALNAVLVVVGAISADNYTSLTMAIIAIYSAANVAQKQVTKGAKNGSDTAVG